MINRLIRSFILDESSRKQIVFSDVTKIRLSSDDPVNQFVTLKSTVAGFPLGTDIFFETGFLTPQALNKWLKFEAVITEDTTTFGLPVGTSLGFKVKTTGGNYWWDGGAWAVAGPTDWSTEAQINANISTFPIVTVGDKGIGFVVNLRTTDPTVTPEVRELKLCGEFDIEFLDDLVYDSVIRKLNTDFRSTSVLVFTTSVAISSQDLAAVLENKGYNITGIRRVVNLSDDPMKLANLFLSYAPGALRQDGFTFEPGIVTFTGAIPLNKLVEITFEYVPEIYIRQGQDFFEVPKFPSLIFENVEVIRGLMSMPDTNSYGVDYVRDKADMTAILQYGPTQHNVRFSYAAFTNKQTDQMRLMNDINQFFSRNKTIRGWGLDLEYGLDIVAEVETSGNERNSDDTDTNVATGAFDVLGVLFYHKASVDGPLVGNGQVNITTFLQ